MISVSILIGRSPSEGTADWRETVLEGKGTAKIAQINVTGEIAPSSDGMHPVIAQLDQAMKDPRVLGVVLSVNSPGGDVVTSDNIHQKIEQVKQTGRPVVVSMGSIAASGGYYVSANADKIYAPGQKRRFEGYRQSLEGA